MEQILHPYALINGLMDIVPYQLQVERQRLIWFHIIKFFLESLNATMESFRKSFSILVVIFLSGLLQACYLHNTYANAVHPVYSLINDTIVRLFSLFIHKTYKSLIV